MLDLHAVKGQDLKALSPEVLAALATQMLAHIDEQARHIDQQSQRISSLGLQVDSQAQGIKWRDAKIEAITFQLAKLKAWRSSGPPKNGPMPTGVEPSLVGRCAAAHEEASVAAPALAQQLVRPPPPPPGPQVRPGLRAPAT